MKDVWTGSLTKPSEKKEGKRTPAARRIDEALDVLAALGVPREQQNVRSALTLLALLIIVRHRANLRRLREGTEPRLALRRGPPSRGTPPT